MNDPTRRNAEHSVPRVVVRALVSADRVAAWNAVNQVVADEDLYREAHAIATRLSRLGGIDVHRTIAGSFEE